MSNIDDALDDVLGIEKEIKKEIKETNPNKIIPRKSGNDDIDVDYEYSRENFYNLIERGQDAIEGILDLAKESEHPRTYEVAGQLIKTVSEVTERLADLQQKMKQLKNVPEKGPKNITNALFVGSTQELQKLIKGKN